MNAYDNMDIDDTMEVQLVDESYDFSTIDTIKKAGNLTWIGIPNSREYVIYVNISCTSPHIQRNVTWIGIPNLREYVKKCYMKQNL